MRRFKSLLTVVLLAIGLTSPLAASPPPPLTVFAAASLTETMNEVDQAWRQHSGQTVRNNFAGSSVLARQIAQGAPADVYVSADLAWMDWLQQRELIDASTRRNLLGNALVLIAPKASAATAVSLNHAARLLPLLGQDGRLAVALTDSVPAGKYAKAALQSLGLWDTLHAHLAEADNVRAALLLVSHGEAPLGIVYRSDALADAQVKVLGVFPADSHPPIIYPVARVKASINPQAAAFVAWLHEDTAAAIFRKHGFDLR